MPDIYWCDNDACAELYHTFQNLEKGLYEECDPGTQKETEHLAHRIRQDLEHLNGLRFGRKVRKSKYTSRGIEMTLPAYGIRKIETDKLPEDFSRIEFLRAIYTTFSIKKTNFFRKNRHANKRLIFGIRNIFDVGFNIREIWTSGEVGDTEDAFLLEHPSMESIARDIVQYIGWPSQGSMGAADWAHQDEDCFTNKDFWCVADILISHMLPPAILEELNRAMNLE